MFCVQRPCLASRVGATQSKVSAPISVPIRMSSGRESPSRWRGLSSGSSSQHQRRISPRFSFRESSAQTVAVKAHLGKFAGSGAAQIFPSVRLAARHTAPDDNRDHPQWRRCSRRLRLAQRSVRANASDIVFIRISQGGQLIKGHVEYLRRSGIGSASILPAR